MPDSDWRIRYSDAYHDRTTDKPITLETIRLAKGIKDDASAHPRDCNKLKELAAWCENADEFGTLLWMATMLEF